MIDFFAYISVFLIIFAYVCYLVMIFIGNKNKVSKNNGFDITKEIISEYNSINVIESKGYFSVYNIKRKVIKLASMCYYGNSLSMVSLSLIEAGISVIDNMKNKYIDLYRRLFSNLKILYIFPIIALVINNITYNISDVRIGIIFIVIFTFISYTLIDIKSRVIEWISDNLNKVDVINNENYKKIINFINKMLWLDKFIFFGELIIIIRFVAILLEMI